MSLEPLIPYLLAAFAGSMAAAVAAAASGSLAGAHAAAAFYALTVVWATWRANAPYWQPGAAAAPGEAVHAARRNMRLAALVYAWGAASLFAVYRLSGLHWYHYWQYGLGAALFAAGLLAYAQRLSRPGLERPPPLALTVAHGAAVAAALLYLVGSGALTSARTDWAANPVFLWGGLALLFVCAAAFATQRRLARS